MIPSTVNRNIIIFVASSLIFAVASSGQNSPAPAWEVAPVYPANTTKKIYIVTISHPKKRHTCMMQSINTSEIVCDHHGRLTIYKAQDVAAIIEPGEHTPVLIYVGGILAASGAAAWGTGVLASVCIPCAVVTGVAALFLFMLAPGAAMAADGDSSDTLMYLAPGQKLQVKLKRP